MILLVFPFHEENDRSDYFAINNTPNRGSSTSNAGCFLKTVENS